VRYPAEPPPLTYTPHTSPRLASGFSTASPSYSSAYVVIKRAPNGASTPIRGSNHTSLQGLGMADEDCSTKRCPKCGEFKALGRFAGDKRRKDGLKCWCRDCNSAAYRTAYHGDGGSTKERMLAAGKAWRAANPEKQRAFCREWQRRNPEATKANFDRWRAANREKVLIWARSCYGNRKGAIGKYTKADVDALMSSQRGKCAYCRKALRGKFHVDHIMPLSKGGTNEPRNIQLTCAPCNLQKHDKHPIEFARQMGRLL
jgi:5-methylcytosine-specific restriction endonuclease McrA